MCINPVLLPNGQEVACHLCWQCVRRKIDDWTGRCIAESETAVAVSMVTLTYGRDARVGSVDHERAAWLTYSDVQKYLRAWRDTRSKRAPRGYPVRYFVVGEYGATKGRAHWHALLFWQDKVPARPKNRQIFDRFYWPHGYSFWTDGRTPEAVRYVCKYIAKEVFDEEAQYHKGMSRFPPLGDAYFRQLASDLVEEMLAPQDFFYRFENVRNRKDEPVEFQMQGKTRENFLRYYRDAWIAKFGDMRLMPNSEIVEEFLDAEVRRGSQDDAKRVLAAEKHGVRESVMRTPFTGVVQKPTDIRPWMDPKRIQFSDGLNVWMYVFDGAQRPWYWARDNQGVWGWRARIGSGHAGVGVSGYRQRSQV